MGGGVSIPVALSSAQKEILEGKYQLYQSRGCDDAELEGMLAKRLPGIVLFDQIDADHSGSISRAELKAMLKALPRNKPVRVSRNLETQNAKNLGVLLAPKNNRSNRSRRSARARSSDRDAPEARDANGSRCRPPKGLPGAVARVPRRGRRLGAPLDASRGPVPRKRRMTQSPPVARRRRDRGWTRVRPRHARRSRRLPWRTWSRRRSRPWRST